MEVTSNDIKKALAKKHGDREFFMTECKSGSTGRGMLQFDAVAIYKSWVNPQIRGYEIKVSRSDFKQDSKYALYRPYFHEFYFVVPSGMVERHEIEEGIGLMWYNPKNGALTTKRKAIWKDIEISADMLLYIIMNRLESDRIPFYGSKAEYWKAWVENKISNRELGYQVKNKLAQEIQDMERKVRNTDELRADRKLLSELYNVMNRHGVRPCNANSLDKTLCRGYPTKLDNLSRDLNFIASQVTELVEVNNLIKIKEVQNDD